MGKRRPGSRAPIILCPYWGAKSARTASQGGSASSSSSTRDWADLGDGPASLVAERVLAADVVGYLSFRAVCRSWRRCCDDPRTRSGGVLDDPRWIMLLDEGEKLTADASPHCCRRGFLNVSTAHCIHVDVRELSDHGVLRSTAADGLLFLHSRATGDVRLLNPLTRQAADLSPITSLGKFYPGYIGIDTYSTAGLGLADDHTVWLKFSDANAMAFAKPGDERWVPLENVRHLLVPNVFFAGRFYGVTSRAIMTIDMTRGDDLPPRLVVAAELDMPVGEMENKTLHLVDNGGKLSIAKFDKFRN